jgi:hypothetical protein
LRERLRTLFDAKRDDCAVPSDDAISRSRR